MPGEGPGYAGKPPPAAGLGARLTPPGYKEQGREPGSSLAPPGFLCSVDTPPRVLSFSAALNWGLGWTQTGPNRRGVQCEKGGGPGLESPDLTDPLGWRQPNSSKAGAETLNSPSYQTFGLREQLGPLPGLSRPGGRCRMPQGAELAVTSMNICQYPVPGTPAPPVPPRPPGAGQRCGNTHPRGFKDKLSVSPGRPGSCGVSQQASCPIPEQFRGTASGRPYVRG